MINYVEMRFLAENGCRSDFKDCKIHNFLATARINIADVGSSTWKKVLKKQRKNKSSSVELPIVFTTSTGRKCPLVIDVNTVTMNSDGSQSFSGYIDASALRCNRSWMTGKNHTKCTGRYDLTRRVGTVDFDMDYWIAFKDSDVSPEEARRYAYRDIRENYA